MRGTINYFISCIICLIFFSPVSGKADTTQQYYLELTGIVRDDFTALPAALVTVYKDSLVFFSQKANQNGKCKIKLLLNEQYSIVFSLPGYVSKKIAINTKVPDSKKGTYKFLYTVCLFEEIEELDISVLKNPVAVIAFNSMMKRFDYDYNYTVLVNKDIQKLYRDYYLQQSKHPNLARSRANSRKRSG